MVFTCLEMMMMLWRGELEKAIKESRSSIIIFSKDYASSQRCLDELVMILECKRNFKHVILPVFYGMDPSQVRKQTGSVAEAFVGYETQYEVEIDERNGKLGMEKVEGWRKALREVADLGGERGFILDLCVLWEDMQGKSVNNTQHHHFDDFMDNNLSKHRRLGLFSWLPTYFVSTESNEEVGLNTDAFFSIWLHWHGFPLKFIANDFPLESLVVLDMRNSSLAQLWEGTKGNWDLSTLSSLQTLRLGFNPICSLPGSLKGLTRLTVLNLAGCIRLQSLPELPMSLAGLDLTRCRSLETVANLPNLFNLLMLDISHCEEQVEIQGLLKLEPIGNIDSEMINNLSLTEWDFMGMVEFELYSNLIGAIIKAPTLQVAEFLRLGLYDKAVRKKDLREW
ncbi:unnamed protein product [Camellia sinensis]